MLTFCSYKKFSVFELDLISLVMCRLSSAKEERLVSKGGLYLLVYKHMRCIASLDLGEFSDYTKSAKLASASHEVHQ